ncbi:MAG: UDP-N-acetylmuramoyl-L-alanine--D-glutamate ligase [Deltaproteobacteria bacterium]|nr:UDP-N-acetylmuramoyl-L-alanine--D-glutamate ligase [Deltaproteobacteria bacterium]
MELAGRNVLIIGMGKTGFVTARFLAGRNVRIIVTDEKPRQALEDSLREPAGLRNDVEVREYETGCLSGVDLVVPSPGVPPFNSILREAVKRNIPIVSEIELAFRFLAIPLIAITGTNGKTTTTTLIGDLLKGCGKKVFVGGNIGDPLIGYVGGIQTDDYAVVEVSSFQLQWTEQFHPIISVLLNTTCDHVNYHGSFEAYRRTKERIFANQTGTDFAILNADEPSSQTLAKRLTARVKYFSSSRKVEEGIFLNHETLVAVGSPGMREEYPVDMVKIPGKHNLENVMATILAARESGCEPADIIATVANFRGLPHRIEFAGEKNGITFYDDSKGTNVDAVVRALETFSAPIVLLMGGRDKEGDFQALSPLVEKKVKALVLFGEAREKIHRVLGKTVSTTLSATLGDAVRIAHTKASPGDIILLSPGCASFDEFTDYKARGRFFKDRVRDLIS